MRGFQDAPLDIEQWRRLLQLLTSDRLLEEHARDASDVLNSLVKDGGEPFAPDLLPDANAIAARLWVSLDQAEEPDFDDDWLTRAINRPAGVLVEYWLGALGIELKGREGSEGMLPDYYRHYFSTAIHDTSSNGAYARALLSSQAAYLFRVDEAWTRAHILPLFRATDRSVFAQAWHGFLSWGRLYPDFVNALLPGFIEAISRMQADLPDHRDRLMEFCAAICVFQVAAPDETLLPALFQHGTLEEWTTFAQEIEHLLRQMDAAAVATLWTTWLADYWSDRLNGVFAPLGPSEVRAMLEWLPKLSHVFPAAVELAIQMPLPPRDYNHLLLDLRESEIVEHFPEATANLLIYLADCLVQHQAADLAEVAQRIQDIPGPLRLRLNEALARVGAF